MKFENTMTYNMGGAFRGMRNPLDSWAKSDSREDNGNFIMGERDRELAVSLIRAGASHRKFLRQIFVCTDITAPAYWWNEFDTYKVGTTANSTSKMHRMSLTPVTADLFEDIDAMDPYWIRAVAELETLRLKYLETKDISVWRELLKRLPLSHRQKRTVTLDYETLRAIAGQRKNHKLKEWSTDFMRFIEKLPYAKVLILD